MIKVGSKVTLVKVRVGVGRLVTLNISTTARYNTWFFLLRDPQKRSISILYSYPRFGSKLNLTSSAFLHKFW